MRWTVRHAQEEDAAELARVNVASLQHTYAGIVDPAYLSAMDVESYAARWADRIANLGAMEALFVAECIGAAGGVLLGSLAGRP